ncbi:hypothetical protein F511_37808 [Dorcoceras hygrometricum]|uniref:Uncharacterized protein n=1 Tax=Dorcoceras hygrometricum TaxID=472368 RepID=A0A2Z7APT3_9LAMI|nr:hypothetical protein F511_37808 [Dorcoceras hygrometricum]
MCNINLMTSRLLPQASSTDMMTSWLLNLDFFRSAMLTSSLLLVATSSRHADVIIAESRFLFASNPSAMLTSSLLLVATSSRHADVIIAESRFLFASNPSATSSRHADVIIAESRFLFASNPSAMLTSSLLLVATSSRHADVIIAESRFLFASNPSVVAFEDGCCCQQERLGENHRGKDTCWSTFLSIDYWFQQLR